MRSFDPKWSWLPLAVGGVATLAAIGLYWGASEELVNRALIAAGSVWLIYRARHLPVAANGTSRGAGFTLLVGAVLVVPPAWFLLAQAGPRSILVWWLTFGWLVAASGGVLMQRGWSGLRTLAFPLLFLLFALPTPMRFEGPLQEFLQNWTTTISAAVLQALSFHCVRKGFVLHLTSGDLGVVEACSGIRSVTALTAVAAFIAYWRGFGLLRGFAFVLLSLPVIVAANVLRITFSGVLQETVGREAVQGTAHEVLGFATILVGLAALLGLSRLFGRALDRPALLDTSRLAPTSWSWGSRLTFGLPTLMLAASAVVAGFALGKPDAPAQSAPLDEIATDVGGWHGTESPIPELIPETLGYDRVLHRIYRNAIGQEVEVWVIFWSRIRWDRGYHHPDLCLGNQGWTLDSKRALELQIESSTVVPATIRRFRSGERGQLVCYWTQEGARVWTDADEANARAGGAHGWIREGLKGRVQSREARISVLISTQPWGANRYSEDALLSFSRGFAAELYRVLPWAVPTQ